MTEKSRHFYQALAIRVEHKTFCSHLARTIWHFESVTDVRKEVLVSVHSSDAVVIRTPRCQV